MLNDASGFQKIYVATGYTDLRRGMEGLANIIRFRFHLDPYDKNTLFLFCGKRTDRIKGLLWEGEWDSCYYTNGWIPELSTGRETAKKHCRSLRSSTQCSCRDLRSLPDAL